MRLLSFNTPHTPLTAKDDDLSFLRLIRSRRVGHATFHRMIAEHGGVAAALDALPEIARQAGVKDYTTCTEAAAFAELKAGRKANARLVRCDQHEYPALLRQISDAPPVIWVKGNLSALNRPMIAVIGARNASSLGLRMARGMAGALSEMGIGIVAGLARGIDTAAHEASLKAGTVAVMAGGIDQIYPAENSALAAMLCDRGCLLSEQPPGLSPVARHFPLRNRIISGLSHGVVVVEAAVKSGSLITARDALDQGREVMAVPGHPVDGRAGGCNQLLRDGATLVRNAEDVLLALPQLQQAVATGEGTLRNFADDAFPAVAPGRPSANITAAAQGDLPLPHRGASVAQVDAQVLSHLSPSPTEENALIRDTGLSAANLAPVLLRLELSGKLTRLAGGRIALL
ncbi:DNA-protecting protein DprA [Paracoccus aurantiacus]|uniref:DNA-protecting protein DprA n=1 Tax=Paracoccus aurantiacus TaxID=2599412 RepID=A0A5C6S6P1_9RHOB|nr:DNA-processing protein DprA [Paracoccus aurantiacus]TXB69997.1 DNA-protecting protein DprA [Paracoccus aurantiacus]